MSHSAGTAWPGARDIAYRSVSALPPVELPLVDAVGETLAAEVTSLCDVPATDISAMDGWAVAGTGPWKLQRLSARERVYEGTLHAGSAVPILTGSPMPHGARAVLRSEHGKVDCEGLLVRNGSARTEEPREGEHVRPAGEELRRGERVIDAGTELNPAHVAVAAAAGLDALLVLPRPRVSLLLTGDEVIERGVPGPGQVRDSFGISLPAVHRMLGGTVTTQQRLPDDPARLTAALQTAVAASDLIVTTGGTGFSDADHLHAALEELGAELLIDGIAMRPGHPCLLARLPSGALVAGLPGNPLAAMVGLLTLVAPALAGLRGERQPRLGSVTAGAELAGNPGRHQLVPYRLIDGAAEPATWRGPAMLRGLAGADGLLVVPPDGAAIGETVPSLALPWLTRRDSPRS